MAELGPRAGDGVPRWLAVVGGWAWRLVAVAAAGWVVLWLIGRFSVVFLPVAVTLILATIAVPAGEWLVRRGAPRALAAAVIVVGGVAAMVGLGFLIAPQFTAQVTELAPTVEDGIDSLVETAAGFGFDEQRLQELLDTARERLSGSSGQIAAGVASGIVAVGQGLTSLLLVLVLLFFVIKDAEEMRTWSRDKIAPRQRDLADAVARRAWVALGGYVRGTATIALVDAVAIGIGLAVIGVPLVLPLALLVFLGAFLPVIGAAIAGSVAVLVALASGGPTTALLALAVVVGVQQLEGNVLQPMIMRRAVALHPVVVLLALAAGATLAGIVGAFLSIPVAAVLSAVGNELRLRARDDAATQRQFDRGGTPADGTGHRPPDGVEEPAADSDDGPAVRSGTTAR